MRFLCIMRSHFITEVSAAIETQINSNKEKNKKSEETKHDGDWER